MNMNKTLFALTTFTILWLGYGCASVATVTDSVILYPANQSAERWGTLNFYQQYQSNTTPQAMTITLPNGKVLNGQITYVVDSGKTTDEGGFWDNVHIGVGVGVGHRHGGFGGVSISPRSGTYRSDKSQVAVNAFGDGLGLNCNGVFNARQNSGTLQCQLNNGMAYQGTLRRVIVR